MNKNCDDINLLDNYDYYLPPKLIANSPIMPKEEARLLVYDRKNDKISHLKFENLYEILPECEILFNDTKVIKARMFGKKESGGKIELLMNSPLENNKFSAYIRGSVKEGTILEFDKNLKATVLKLFDDGLRIISFTQNGNLLSTHEIYNILDAIGHVPLPPYIKREDCEDDETWYQSIFAKNQGAVAAPTASLHFSEEMLERLKQKHKFHYLTLHVGAGTFKGVDCSDIKEHKMHSEFYSIPDETAKIIDSKVPILGVGTTVTRTIEYYARGNAKHGYCDLFLNLNNKPIRQNFLLTNFHLPKSTLIILVTSFIGLEKTMKIYEEAVKEQYRFYSYGDGMLIL